MPKLKRRKVQIDATCEIRDFSGKVYRHDGVDNDEAVQMAIEGAGWDDNDPGVGGAVILDDGRELLNPVPMAPPVNFSNEMSVNDLVERSLKMHFEKLSQDKEAQETLDELMSFEDDDDLEPTSPWEVIEMKDEIPDIPNEAPVIPVKDPPGVPPPKEVEPKPVTA